MKKNKRRINTKKFGNRFYPFHPLHPCILIPFIFYSFVRFNEAAINSFSTFRSTSESRLI